MVDRDELTYFDPRDGDNQHVFVSVPVQHIEMDSPETKYVSGRFKGEEVSPETYRVYIDKMYEEPPISIDFGHVAERYDTTIAVDFHKEDIYTKSE